MALELRLTPEMLAKYRPLFALSQAARRQLMGHLFRRQPRSILETGPGASSILLFQYQQQTPGVEYYVLDQPSEHHDKFVAHMQELGFDTSNILARDLVDSYYDTQDLPFAPEKKFDLLLLDGPHRAKFRSSPAAITFLKNHIGPQTDIIQDDTQRRKMRHLVQTMLDQYPEEHFRTEVVQDEDYARTTTFLTSTAR